MLLCHLQEYGDSIKYHVPKSMFLSPSTTCKNFQIKANKKQKAHLHRPFTEFLNVFFIGTLNDKKNPSTDENILILREEKLLPQKELKRKNNNKLRIYL